MKNSCLKDDLIVIGPSYMKKKVLNENKLHFNIKYIDEYQLKDKYLYSYKDGVNVYLDRKYNFIPEVTNIILNILYEIDIEKRYKTSKLNKLVEIKRDLIENEYIRYNEYFKTFLTNKEILILDNFFDAKILKIIEKLKKCNNVIVCEKEDVKKSNIDILEFKTLEEEASFVASKIVELVNDGIDINNIKINMIDSVYNSTISKIFKFYNIPCQDKGSKLYYLDDVKCLLNRLSSNTLILDINDILDGMDINDRIKNKIISIFNKYVDYKTYGEIEKEFIYELKNTNIIINKYNNVIEYIDYKNYIPNDDEYVFIMGLNQDYIPMIHKDNGYLNDKELEEIGSDTTSILNQREILYLNEYINKTKNIYISYKLSSNFDQYSKSNFINELDNINIIPMEYNYDNDKLNQVCLASRIDNYIKYNYISDDLNRLYSYYPNINYNSYDNRYKKINLDTIKKQLDNKINLSYTNTNTFFRCKFRFLLDTIYKLAPFEETLSQKIGNLFHDVLCTLYKENKNLDEIIDDIVGKYFTCPNKKELFYIGKYKETLRKLVDNLNEQLDKTKYINTYFEEWFSISKDNDLEFKIVGKIDKILTLKDDKNTYVIVIDYKTGSMHSDFNKVIYGLDMQLLYYLYLIKNTDKINNPFFTGMYLQSIMSEILSSEKNKTYEELEKDNLRLFGYTIEDVAKLYDIDNNYNNSSYIRGIKVKNDGTFYQYSKVLSEETINELINIVENNLNEVMDSIKLADFTINPKKIGNENVGCEYCQFKDICYMNNDNIVELEEYKDLEFLGGDDSDTN